MCKEYVYSLVGFALLSVVCAAPLGSRRILPAGDYDPEEAAGMYEGDMLLSEAQINLLESKINGRNGLVSESRRWPDNTVVYRISSDFDNVHKAAILEGIRTLEENTCVIFREATAEDEHYLAIGAKPGGCFTAVGYLAKVQEMNLQIYPIGEGCFRRGTILHEFMHALGFYHQQSSSIRDSYIKVMYENIVPGREFNFDKYGSNVVTDFDVGYDYDSCLHYRAGAYSANGKDTIVPLDPNAQIGQRLTISRKDIAKINIMYKCPIQV